uniref:ATP-dependent DNA helicase n=1 Tax=Denticeps clupeoides TaxID=299321 RepID=A0AAY4APP7_9TELE
MTATQQALKTYFGFDRFRSQQQEDVVKAVVKGDRDVFVCMPTGAGKSLCYQLPAMLSSGITLVISPLIALIQDQVEHLRALNIPARSINSKLPLGERRQILADLHSERPKLKLLYITPEMVASQTFQPCLNSLSSRGLLSCLAVDEAHCVSQWGHDFRPDYLKLGELRAGLPGVPCVALTATAPKRVQEDIARSLNLRSPLTFATPVFRSNLYYDVIARDSLPDPCAHLHGFISDALKADSGQKGCGIVYCRTRESCDEVAHKLTRLGVLAKPYHAGLKTSDRTEAQTEWMEGKVPVIVATISFGMGVDKANVRFVAHWNMAKSLASYYQESGRAGRDGLPSNCRIYYSRQDRQQMSFLIRKEISRKQTKRGSEKELDKAAMLDFEAMAAFCEQEGCRHATISKFFGDKAPICARTCDFCRDPSSVRAQLARIVCLSTRTGPAQSQEPRGPFGLDSSAYGGGKKGYGFERYDEEWEGSAEDDTDRRKKEFSDMFKKQMRMRKANLIHVCCYAHTDDDCPLKEASSQRIPTLTVKAREHCLVMLQEALSNHKGAAESGNIFSMALEIEFEIFKSSKSANIYKHSVLKKVSEIKKEACATAPPVDRIDGANIASVKTEEQTISSDEAASSSSISEQTNEVQGFMPASQIYSMKRKRIGAGLRGSSTLFQSASDFLHSSKTDTSSSAAAVSLSGQTNTEDEAEHSKSEIKGKESASSLNSPTKRVVSKTLSRKQQKLAEAARETHCISQYFAKKLPNSAKIIEEQEDIKPFEEDDLLQEQTHSENHGSSSVGSETSSDAVVMDTTPTVGDALRTVEAKQDMECPPEGDVEEEDPHPPTKRACPPKNGDRRKVTFNPHMQERLIEPRSSEDHGVPHQPVTLKEAADIVVKCLDPFYRESRFSNKDLFKAFARFLSHQLTEGKQHSRIQVKTEAKRLIKQFFSSIRLCESEMDWEHLICDFITD